VDTTPGAPTLEVVIVALSRNPTNKLAVTRAGRSNLLGRNASIIVKLPCLWQREQNYPECTDSRCSRDCSLCEHVQQVRHKPIERIESVGKECEHRRATAMLLARSRDCPECSDSGRSRHSSVHEPIQQVRYKPFKRIDLVGKDVIIITNDHLRSWREVDKARTWT
jgi:hypothetical protein